jgi:hypothetical protein
MELKDIDAVNLLDRIIIGPSQYSWALYEASVNVLKTAGVDTPEARVFISGIPVRTDP